mmetsp:Transcript_31554/g.65940  ORF Transcript_31554/g.65940 Transcript_31554/m.65940 type:complete len:179 (+) Transcript_31554:1751-2287(+)
MMEDSALIQALASVAAGTTHSSGTGTFKVLASLTAMPFAPAPSTAERVQRQPDQNLPMKSPEGTPQNSTASSLSGVTNMTNATSSIYRNDGNNALHQYALAQALRTFLLPQSRSLQQTFDTIKASIIANRSSSVPGDQPGLHAHQSLPSEMVRRNFAPLSSSEVCYRNKSTQIKRKGS